MWCHDGTNCSGLHEVVTDIEVVLDSREMQTWDSQDDQANNEAVQLGEYLESIDMSWLTLYHIRHQIIFFLEMAVYVRDSEKTNWQVLEKFITHLTLKTHCMHF